MYVVAASNHPDRVECPVPWRVDEREIFFGPCKKRIRERLRRQFLGPGVSHRQVSDGPLMVGVNGNNVGQVRKIVFAGWVRQVMTFQEGSHRLVGDRYRALLDAVKSPLHVRPIVQNGKLIGYEHVSEEHLECGEWVEDLVSDPDSPLVRKQGRTLLVRNGSAWQAFDRDCCMVLENHFFAQGQEGIKGIKFDDEALNILRQAQPGTLIDRYAIFGRAKNGTANGLRGTYLEIVGDLAETFIKWLGERTEQAHRRT
jgi:hypothetical protein